MDETLNTLQGMKNIYQPTGIGARLKAARETLHLSEKEVAARLRLNTRFIHMMENETFESNLPDTFMRGYFRSYARLLNFNESDINAAIAQINIASHPPETATACTPTKRKVHQLDRYLRWVSYAIISLLAVLVVFWWASHPRDSEADLETKTSAQEDLPLPPASASTAITAPKLGQPPIQAAAPPTVIPPQQPLSINAGRPEANNSVKQPEKSTPVTTASNTPTPSVANSGDANASGANASANAVHLAANQQPKPSTLNENDESNDTQDIY